MIDSRAVFGLSIAMSFAGSIALAKLYVWPRLTTLPRADSLSLLIAPHLLLRFIGLSFLMPGVVSPDLPAAFAVPAAYGDLVSGVLAIVAAIGLARTATWALASVWVFNTVGATDLVFAFVQGARTHIDPGSLGAAFFIPTAIVPALLVSHVLILRLLVPKRIRVHATQTLVGARSHS